MSSPTAIDDKAVAVAVIGAGARRACAGSGPARVIAVFRRAFYLETDAGLACFGSAAIGHGPLNAILSPAGAGPPPSLAPGQAATIADGRLRLAGGATLALDRATLWRPPPPPARWSPATLRGSLDALAAADHAPGEGLERFIPWLVDRRRPPPGGDPLALAAAPAIAALDQWLTGAGADEPPAAVAGLIGLGPGLTPSGDDLLGGAMIALRHFGATALADRLGAWTLDRAAATGTIARAHLAAAADGLGASVLHDMLAALETGVGVGVARDGLAALGHSSGWDGLAGIVVAARALAVGAQSE